MMDYEKFKKAIMEMAQGFSNDIMFLERIKEGRKLDAMTLKPSAGRKVTPLVYINDLYNSYTKNGSASIETMLDEAMKILFSDSPEISAIEEAIVSGKLLTKDNIIVCFIPKDRAVKDPTYVCMPYLDMYIGYKIIAALDGPGSDMTINLTKPLAERLGIKNPEGEAFFKEILNNTERLFPAEIKSMAAMIEEGLREQGEPECLAKEIANTIDDSPMYIITNKHKVNGAATILYEQNNPLRILAERLGDDLMILPSSKHEVIAIPSAESIDPVDARTIVTEINATELSANDVLSDSVYLYHRDTGDISIME